MAKKRAKKAAKRASKAKASQSPKRLRAAKAPKRSLRWPVDPQTGSPLLFHPVTGEAYRDPRQAELPPRTRRKLERREQSRRAESRASRLERLARRDAKLTVRRRVVVEQLPPELEAWLLEVDGPGRLVGEELVGDVLRSHGESLLESRVVYEAIGELAREWYLRGCRQGYIEGRVEQLVSRRQVADKRNRLKREQSDMDERDARIFKAWPSLKREHGAEEAERLIAKDEGIGDRRVRQIVLEQRVLCEHAALVLEGLGEAAAVARVVEKNGVDKDGKPSQKRQATVRKILEKARLRSFPEMP